MGARLGRSCVIPRANLRIFLARALFLVSNRVRASRARRGRRFRVCAPPLASRLCFPPPWGILIKRTATTMTSMQLCNYSYFPSSNTRSSIRSTSLSLFSSRRLRIPFSVSSRWYQSSGVSSSARELALRLNSSSSFSFALLQNSKSKPCGVNTTSSRNLRK